MSKYKYAVKQEIKWLEEEIEICQQCLDGKDTPNCSMEEVRSRKRWAENELGRLRLWMKEYKERMAGRIC